MLTQITCIAVALITSSAFADMRHVVMEWEDATHTRAILRPDQDFLDPAVPQYGYDNWRDTQRGGLSERIGSTRVSGNDVGDDMTLVAPGLLTGENLTLVHMGTTGIGTEFVQTNRWFDGDGVLLQEFTFIVGASLANFGPGVTLNVRAGDGFWTFLNLDLPQQVFASHQWSNPIGMDINDFGQAIAGPRTIGYSSQYIRNFTAGQDIDLGSDQLNLCLALRVDPVPTPSVCSIVAAGSVLTIRRRR